MIFFPFNLIFKLQYCDVHPPHIPEAAISHHLMMLLKAMKPGELILYICIHANMQVKERGFYIIYIKHQTHHSLAFILFSMVYI